MSKFKAGDKVIDIGDNPSVHYTVGDVDNRGYLKITYGGYTYYYNPDRFELVEEQKPVSSPVVFKIGSFYIFPKRPEYGIYQCCGFTSTGIPFFEIDGTPSLLTINDTSRFVEYVKPIEVGSKVYSNVSDREFIVTAIHDGYAWVHTEGSKGGSIQKLSTLRLLG